MKVCSRCGGLRAEFYSDKRASDGLRSMCKDCERIRAARYWRANRLKMRKMEKDWAAKFPEKVKARQTAYRERNPLREKARRAVRNAVRDGRTVKAWECQDCHRTGRLDGHHHDYFKPFEVEWLCSSCHGKRHREVVV